ncbi:ABC-2 family transporter protein [compost metagenome]
MWVVLGKELRDLLRNWGILIALVLPSLLIPTVALAVLYVAAHPPQGLPPEALMPPSDLALPPELEGAESTALAQYAALSPFFMIWLIFPVTIPSILAATSIVGEKEAGTLEPLLATPIRTWELLLAKALASVIPALVLTWLPFAVLLGVAQRLAPPEVLSVTLLSPPWLFGVGVLAPSLTLLTVMFLVIVSAWVTEVRTANQLGAVLIAPLVAMIVIQVTRGLTVTMGTVLGIWAVVLALLALTLPVAVRLFQRETILVRWKQSGG